jgi:hypothetical protein
MNRFDDLAKEFLAQSVWMHNNTFMPSSVSDKVTAVCHKNGIKVIAGGCPMMFFDTFHKCMKWVLHKMGRLPDISSSRASVTFLPLAARKLAAPRG